jgi:uncharacterized repeat protein (TIGR02543 family)
MKTLYSLTSVVLLALFLTACNSITHNIIFESNGGSTVETLVVSTTSDFSMPTNPMREGYYFGGWYYDNTTFNDPFSINSFLSAPLSQDLVLYAKWNSEPNIPIGSLTVNFISDNLLVQAIHLNKGASISPLTITKQGYALEGWYLSSDQGRTLSGRFDFLNNKINSNLTFYAYWIDIEPPVLRLVGSNIMVVQNGTAFVDPGVICTDSSGQGCLTKVEGTVDTNTAGTYELIYTAVDQAGNEAVPVTRVVIVNQSNENTSNNTSSNQVKDIVAPVITLNGSSNIELEVGQTYSELGATCSDNIDLQCVVSINGSVDTSKQGTYVLTYSASDQAGNLAIPLTRVVIVNLAKENTNQETKTDNDPPKLTVYLPFVELGINDSFLDIGVGYSDNNDGNCTFVPQAFNGLEVDLDCPVVVSGRVDTSIPGTYTLKYNASDLAGNKAQEVQREVIVYQTLRNLRVSEGTRLDLIFIDNGKLMTYNNNGQSVAVDFLNENGKIVTNIHDKIEQIKIVGNYLFIKSDFKFFDMRDIRYGVNNMGFTFGSNQPRIYVVNFESNERIITQLNEKELFYTTYLRHATFFGYNANTGFEQSHSNDMNNLYYSNSDEVFIRVQLYRESHLPQILKIFTNEDGLAEIELFLDYLTIPTNSRVYMDYDNGHAILLIDNVFYIYEQSTGMVKLNQQVDIVDGTIKPFFKGLDGKLIYTDSSSVKSSSLYGNNYYYGDLLAYYYDEAGQRFQYKLSSELITSSDYSNLPTWYLEALYESIKTEYEIQGPTKLENRIDSYTSSSSISNYFRTDVIELLVRYLETGEGLTELIESSNTANADNSNQKDLTSWELFSYNLLLDYKGKNYSISTSVNQNYFSYHRGGSPSYRLIADNVYYIRTGDRPFLVRIFEDRISFSLMNPNILDYSHISNFNNYIVGYRGESLQVVDFDNPQSDPISDLFIGDDFVSVDEIRIKPNGVVVVIGKDFSLNVIEVEYSLLTDLI